MSSHEVLLAVFAACCVLGPALSAPPQITTSGELLVHLDARDLVVSPSDPVASWPNRGSLGGHFLSGDPGQTPSLVIADSVSAVRFRQDNTPDAMVLKSTAGDVIAVPATLTGTSDWTVEIWVHKTAFRTVEEAILQWAARGGPDGTAAQVHFTRQALKPVWAAVGHWGYGPDMGWADPADATDARTPSLDQWHLLTCTYDGVTEKVYVDGALVNSEDKTLDIWGPDSIHPGHFVLGAANYGHAGASVDLSYAGDVASLRIHSGALADEQVAANYLAEYHSYNRALIPPVVACVAQPFPLHGVRLLNSPFRDAMDIDTQYLLALEPDRLLAGFRIEAGLPTKADHYGGWESGVRGHTLGHYLSACSLMFASSGDTRCLERAAYVVDELAFCQDAHGDGYVGAVINSDQLFADIKAGNITINDAFHLNGSWVPFYVLHKDYAGLRDAYLHTGNPRALQVLTRACDWVIDLIAGLDHSQMQAILSVEQGGLYELFADVYALTGDTRYLDLADRWRHDAVMNPLAQQLDQLDGLHANTQIPKIIGAARNYELTADAAKETIARFFYDRVVHHHSYANGGNSDYEHFHAPGRLAAHMGSGDMTETCNTYNMLKLAHHLFTWDADPALADYAERALYNQILTSCYPQPGHFTYKLGLYGGYFQPFSRPFSDFWCCVGTGMENHARYPESIYFHDDSALYLNLFIPSTLDWPEKGLALRLDTDFPLSDSLSLTFTCDQPITVPIHIRYPAWAQDGLFLAVNGQPVAHSAQPGSYATVTRQWNTGDQLSIQIPLSLRVEPTPDNPNRVALFYGPILLAGVFGSDSLPEPAPHGASASSDWAIATSKLIVDARPLDQRILPVPGQPLTFTADNAAWPDDVILVPLYQSHDQHFTAYWDTLPEIPTPPKPDPEPIWRSGPYIFDGADDVILLPDGIVADLFDTTICCWVRLDENRTWARIFDFGSGEAVNMMMTPRTSWGDLYAFCIKNGPGAEQWITAPTFSTGVWRHVAVTLEENLGRLFLDGVEVARSQTISDAPAFLGHTTANYLGDSQFPADPLLFG
ncbi:MAG: glycoside hydrolase family 127 protein, partial [Sedimentisphaerales bacterium]|nr:glycoside hydrolase family 127 protein [Sedimentisphaerales bacterium]